MTMMIETRGLRKAFGDHVVLDGIDLNVAAGTISARLHCSNASTWSTREGRCLPPTPGACGVGSTSR